MSKQLLRIDLMVVIVELWLEPPLSLAGIQNWPLSAESDLVYATSSHEQSATECKCSVSLMTGDESLSSFLLRSNKPYLVAEAVAED
jgi:hypothetical protein